MTPLPIFYCHWFDIITPSEKAKDNKHIYAATYSYVHIDFDSLSIFKAQVQFGLQIFWFVGLFQPFEMILQSYI
jgi:hypothetical protein